MITWFKNFFHSLQNTLSIPYSQNKITSKNSAENTTIQDWMDAVDKLLPLIQEARKECNSSSTKGFGLDVFETNNYLYQVDRLVVKIREYIIELRHHQANYLDSTDLSKQIEIEKINQACLDCYHTIVNLILLFQRLPKGKTLPHDFYVQIQALELECAILQSTIRSFSQLAANQWEEELFNAFFGKRGQLVTVKEPYICSTENLKKELLFIEQKEDQELLATMIEQYEILKKCYVAVRKKVVKDTMDTIYNTIQELMIELSRNELNKERIIFYLYLLFNQIESLRFSANRETRSSRDLLSKIKRARAQLRKACLQHPVANEFIKKITLPLKILQNSNQ